MTGKHKINNHSDIIIKIEFELPFTEAEDSGGTLEANRNNVEKYTAQITLSAAKPAAKIEGGTSRASDMAT